ncbi:MAG: hypothetical protein IPP90_20955 [Gemmatimonadaceae bacterium]|nr:hypothetical protein [Gemmatimonadaceae bacterium]
MRTHPHDTLCGCSIDAVAAAVATRQRAVADAALELRDAALACALAHDRVAARRSSRRVTPRPLCETGARARGGMAELRVTGDAGRCVRGSGQRWRTAGRHPGRAPQATAGNCRAATA